MAVTKDTSGLRGQPFSDETIDTPTRQQVLAGHKPNKRMHQEKGHNSVKLTTLFHRKDRSTQSTEIRNEWDRRRAMAMGASELAEIDAIFSRAL